MTEHIATFVSVALVDECHCSCGWRSGPFYDGLEFAQRAWMKHVKEATKAVGPPKPEVKELEAKLEQLMFDTGCVLRMLHLQFPGLFREKTYIAVREPLESLEATFKEFGGQLE